MKFEVPTRQYIKAFVRNVKRLTPERFPGVRRKKVGVGGGGDLRRRGWNLSSHSSGWENALLYT